MYDFLPYIAILPHSFLFFQMPIMACSNSNSKRISCRGGTGGKTSCQAKQTFLPPVSPHSRHSGARRRGDTVICSRQGHTPRHPAPTLLPWTMFKTSCFGCHRPTDKQPGLACPPLQHIRIKNCWFPTMPRRLNHCKMWGQMQAKRRLL